MRAPERPLPLDLLQRRLRAEMQVRPVPLLVLRVPQFERIAWQLGKRSALRVERQATRAFVESARQLLRSGDLLAHDPQSDIYLATMTAPRAGELSAGSPSPQDCRGALNRIAAAMTLATDLATLGGWTMITNLDGQADLRSAIAVALERGMRDRERYEFFATIGHELRTPLTSIRGYIETLIDGGVKPEVARKFLETARREALRLGRLVDNMFEFSLLDQSSDILNSHGCDLREVAARACDVVALLAADRAMSVRHDLPGILVAVDADALLQAVVNLLENAIKYGRDAGRVELHAITEDGFVRIVVDDDGPGVAAADRDRIFGLRERADGSERPGTGIGLAIVRMIAQRAGGDVCAGDSPLGGARFELLLPVKAELGVPLS